MPRAERAAVKEQKAEERAKRLQAEGTERLRRFSQSVEELREKGYEAKDATFGIVAANVYGLLAALPFAAAAIALFVLFAPSVRGIFPFLFGDLFLLAGLALASIPVHEGLHALAWGAVNRSFDGIRFGVMKEVFTPYCACEVPMQRGKYVTGAAAPFVLLGIGFSAAGICTGYWVLLAAGVFNVFCAGADILVCFKALSHRAERLLDHPQKCGFFAFTKKKESL